ncbi:MAG: hypothetical protein CMK59_13180 [Proteobacteria bacterium]|nr:hypothetical protein [Pseudomonadota bacterium]
MTNTVKTLAEQYRTLASWMEFNDVLPWHVGINWSHDGLIVHLKEPSFSRIFACREVDLISDDQGTTWSVESEGILFTCFIPIHQSNTFGKATLIHEPQSA